MGMLSRKSKIKRSIVEGFYKAQGSRQASRVAPYLADDVEWSISGPVELLGFCGTWRGKAAALELFNSRIPRIYAVSSFEVDELLIDGERVAALLRLTAVQHGTQRSISYRVAQFLQFRNNKVVFVRSLLDSFDAAEQVLARRIMLVPEAPECADQDLVAV